MTEFSSHSPSQDSSESSLRLQLARGDAVVGSVEPVLHHLLVHRDQALFGDEVVAHLRAMLADLACQIGEALAGAGGQESGPEDRHEAIAAALADVPGLLPHLHALALEWQVTLRLQERVGLDPVLSPLLQALIASSEAETSALAMRLLAAQARFVQGQRRMQLALRELPGEGLHGVLVALYAHARLLDLPIAIARQAEAALREGYDEASTRCGLLARLVAGMGAGAVAGLALSHAGVAIFASTLALGRALARDHAVLAMQDGQQARLALELRAAGQKLAAVEEVLLVLHPHGDIPEGLAGISVEHAGAILAQAGGGAR